MCFACNREGHIAKTVLYLMIERLSEEISTKRWRMTATNDKKGNSTRMKGHNFIEDEDSEENENHEDGSSAWVVKLKAFRANKSLGERKEQF